MGAVAAAQTKRESSGADGYMFEPALRSSMHLEYRYVPYILPASQYGEPLKFYDRLAWFEFDVRGMASGYDRLVAPTFDSSSDVHSIGGGSKDAKLALAQPTVLGAGNVQTIDRRPARRQPAVVLLRLRVLADPARRRTGGDLPRHAADCTPAMPKYP